jgi:hypothetical protein
LSDSHQRLRHATPRGRTRVEEKDEPGRAHHGEESTRKEIQDTYSVNPEMRSPVGDLGREVLGSNVGDISPGLLIEVAAKRASAAPGGGGRQRRIGWEPGSGVQRSWRWDREKRIRPCSRSRSERARKCSVFPSSREREGKGKNEASFGGEGARAVVKLKEWIAPSLLQG